MIAEKINDVVASEPQAQKSVWMDNDVRKNIEYFLENAKENNMSADKMIVRMRRMLKARNTDFLNG